MRSGASVCHESAFRSVTAVANGEVPTYVVNRDVLKHPDVVARLSGT